jgi:hypothetical protein
LPDSESKNFGILIGSIFHRLIVFVVKRTLIPSFNLMKKHSVQLIFGILGITATIGISALQPAIAQTSNRDSNVFTNTQGGDSRGGFNSSNSDELSGMFDLFHRAVLGNPRSSSEFRQEQQNSIGSEASDFRQRQQELLRQRQPSTPTTTPQSTPATPQSNQ